MRLGSVPFVAAPPGELSIVANRSMNLPDRGGRGGRPDGSDGCCKADSNGERGTSVVPNGSGGKGGLLGG